MNVGVRGGSAPASEPSRSRCVDQEKRWLRSNQRVLELAEDETVPLIERVRHLAAFASTLDEFFMVRVTSLTGRMDHGPAETRATRPAHAVLAPLYRLAGELMLRVSSCYHDSVLPALTARGIQVLRWEELAGAERDHLHRLFRERVYPLLTPLAVDPAHPFPYISGLSLNLAVVVTGPHTRGAMFARVKVPGLLPRFIEASECRFVALEDVIAAHLPQLFEGSDLLERHAFRVTRARDLERDENARADAVQALEHDIPPPRSSQAVRLEVEESISDGVLYRLVTELGVARYAVYRLRGPLDLAGLQAVADLVIHECTDSPVITAKSGRRRGAGLDGPPRCA